MPTAYSQDSYPPAPVLDIRLSVPGEAPTTDMHSALIDTGADFSISPLPWLLEIDAPGRVPPYVRGLWSNRRLVTLYLVDIHLEQGILPGMEVIGVDSDVDMEDDSEMVIGQEHPQLIDASPRRAKATDYDQMTSL